MKQDIELEHLKGELAELKETAKQDGWFKAGMKIAQALSVRPEVKSKGIIDGVNDLILALDRKPHTLDKSEARQKLKETTEELESCKAELLSMRRKRDNVVSVLIEMLDQIKDSSDAAEAISDEVMQKAQLIAKSISRRTISR